jgi:hypothetical protein
LWERELTAVSAEALGERPTGFDDLLPFLSEVVARTEIKVENGRSLDRIDYDLSEGEPGRIYIVVGGNVLSRGLTLEGLFVSFFIRTASAYDTLLQMGRWFGYRRGYADLPRIWMTNELRGYFYDLAAVEREIRSDIARYSNSHITPLNFGVRIREHPHLAITSKLKMQHAVPASMSFAGSAVQTLVFRHRDRDWLAANLRAASALATRILRRGSTPSTLQGRPHKIFVGVPSEDVLQFLAEYQIHEKHVEMPAPLLQGYIRTQNARGRIKVWNVAFVTRADARMGTLDVSPELQINLINRARFRRGDYNFADVKALMSQMDPALDVNASTEELGTLNRSQLLEYRDETVADRGLLLIYPISKDSSPYPTSGPDRLPLDAVDHVIGVALVFPDVEDGTPQTYWTVDLGDVPRETAEIEEFEVEENS